MCECVSFVQSARLGNSLHGRAVVYGVAVAAARHVRSGCDLRVDRFGALTLLPVVQFAGRALLPNAREIHPS